MHHRSPENYARARSTRLLESSPDRVMPVCPYFGACGGCQYQHLNYSRQLELKRQQVVELLRRVGGFPDPPVQATVPCPVPYGYRNRIMVRTQWHGPEQRLILGFLRYDNRLVVDVEACAIAEPALNTQILNVRARSPPKGGLKVMVRLARGLDSPQRFVFPEQFPSAARTHAHRRPPPHGQRHSTSH